MADGQAPPETRRHRSARPPLPQALAFWGTLAGICLIALNLRGPIVAPAPVLNLIRSDLEMSLQMSGLLTSLPVVCFGVVSFLAIPLLRRCGPDQAIAVCLAGILAGTFVRSAGGAELALAGTVIIGAAITVGNVLVPVVIRRDFPPRRVPLVTGVYTAALNIGSMLTLMVTAPLAGAMGWRAAVALWGVLALMAAVAWLALVGWRVFLLGQPAGERAARDAAAVAGTGTAAQIPAWRMPVAWILLLAFSGQAFAYYGVSTWLPTLLADDLGLGLTAAGVGSSLFQGPAIAGALGVPLLARRLRIRTLVIICAACWMTLPAGLILFPELWMVWVSLGGMAQGAGITVIFLIMVRLGGSDRQAGQLSALVQGGGYLVASLGPVVLGSLHESTGSWTWPLLAVLASSAVLGIAGTFGAGAAERRERLERLARSGAGSELPVRRS